MRRMPRDSERAHRPPIWFGLRPRMLGALVLTATVTLATAALALLAPLQSELRRNSITLGQTTVDGDKTQLGILPVNARGLPNEGRLRRAADNLFHANGAEYVVWDDRFVRRADTDKDSTKPEDCVAPAVVHVALDPRSKQSAPYTLAGDVLVVAARYRAQALRPGAQGRFFVLEMIKHEDFLATADGVVGTAFVYAALVGLAVAVLLGIALSSRLLRRLRLLRDASRSLDEREMSTLVVPEDTVSDEIGELAQSFATMHARLRQQEDARRAFVATASHELRTPLASLDTMLELLAEDLHADPVDVVDARERVGLARIQSRRLAGLATDLLDLSRLDAQLELRSEPVELVETARAVTAEFDLRAQEHQVAIVLDQIGDRAWAQADPSSVARVVRIMLDNALQVAPPQSMIEVRIGNGTGPPSIEVADEGPGVPDAEREIIFERFKRGSERGTEGGFGLGLAIGSEAHLADGRPSRAGRSAPGCDIPPDAPRGERLMAIAALAERVRAIGRFGVDTEFVGEGRYRTLLCVIQLVVGDDANLEVVVLDALDDAIDLQPLAGLLADPAISVVVHAGRQDVALLRRHLRTEVTNIFDTQVAAGFAGLAAQAGYETLLREVLGVRVQKTASYTRWDRRPLDTEQLAYAREDVLHLLELATALERRLNDAGRLSWALEECRFLEGVSDARDVDTIFARLPRVNSLAPSSRAIARELVRWREQIAERQDRPVTTVLNDAALVELAKRAPQTPEQLDQIRGVNPGSLRRRGGDLLGAIAHGATLPPIPAEVERHEPSAPVDGPQIALAEAFVRARALEAGLAYELIAARADLSAMVVSRRTGRPEPAVRTLTGWRRELVGEELLALLGGERTIAVGAGGRLAISGPPPRI